MGRQIHRFGASDLGCQWDGVLFWCFVCTMILARSLCAGEGRRAAVPQFGPSGFSHGFGTTRAGTLGKNMRELLSRASASHKD